MCGHTRDQIIYSKFHRNPFRGFGAPGGQNLAFPITLGISFYNSLYYRTCHDIETPNHWKQNTSDVNKASGSKAKAKKYKTKAKDLIFKAKATNYRKSQHLLLVETIYSTTLWKSRCYDKRELLYIEECLKFKEIGANWIGLNFQLALVGIAFQLKLIVAKYKTKAFGHEGQGRGQGPMVSRSRPQKFDLKAKAKDSHHCYTT